MSSDALIYFKDLSPIFSSIVQRLGPNGHFLFSTEHSKESDFGILPSGRFSHSESYVNRLASEHGLKVKAAKQATIRKEYGKKVEGGLYLMSRK